MGQKNVTASPTILLLGDIADVTWRMFVPTIGLTLLGKYIDGLSHSAPLFLICGIILGASLSILLVIRQLKRVRQR